jgi:hypothetical protein
MEARYNKQDTFTVTGVFATRQDAENAYHILMELGYTPDEITLIMSDETQEKLYKSPDQDLKMLLESRKYNRSDENCSTIYDALNTFGKFVALPGVALMVAGDFNDGGVRALSGSIMSDKYAHYFQTKIKDGEIVIDFKPHTARERNIIANLWENCGGDPLVRRARNVA